MRAKSIFVHFPFFLFFYFRSLNSFISRSFDVVRPLFDGRCVESRTQGTFPFQHFACKMPALMFSCSFTLGRGSLLIACSKATRDMMVRSGAVEARRSGIKVHCFFFAVVSEGRARVRHTLQQRINRTGFVKIERHYRTVVVAVAVAIAIANRSLSPVHSVGPQCRRSDERVCVRNAPETNKIENSTRKTMNGETASPSRTKIYANV